MIGMVIVCLFEETRCSSGPPSSSFERYGSDTGFLAAMKTGSVPVLAVMEL